MFIYHFNSAWLPGGFIGVDVFFVISGFLIAGQIFKLQDRGAFSYYGFYQRRIARIAPAAIFAIVATFVAGLILFDDSDQSALGSNIVAAALSAMNIKQIAHEGYFKAPPDTQPLIHYWSLAVEEQFYLLFPLLVHLIYAINRRYCMAILLAICVLSYIASALLTPVAPITSYYLLHTRAWELLAGAVLALAVLDRAPWARPR